MPRNVERDLEARKERCQQILSVAVELFATKGLDATKISDIAAKVGISHGLVYNYFKSKEEIYASLINMNLNSLKEHLDQVATLPAGPLEKLSLLADNLLRHKWDDALFHQIFVDQIMTSDTIPEELKQSVRRGISDNVDKVADLFAEGQRAGVILEGDPRDHSLFFLSYIQVSTACERHGLYVRSKPETVMRYFLNKRS
ncbi:TetR/AcrR family transcriptional regulator [Paenibacillus sp. NPDC056579]|uniref:TetR/AcrR family transcriptional regulator n=1 Tax=unclassified Paenibacillus TaxID=185978 RepID=UPI001EF8966A|nr:TetR/AcrR family transcriptional regulator [Paenibacillus sp. H1-7]